MGEYVLMFLLVVGMVTAMTIYFKRTVQARMFDARNTMFNMVIDRSDGYYNGDLQLGYEPYYGNTDSIVNRRENTTRRLLPGKTTGIFQKTIDDTITIQTQSETAPPRDAK